MRHLALCLTCLLASAAWAGDPLEGSWSGSLDGEAYSLVLKGGGQATVMGQPGRWQKSGASVVVTDADGTRYQGTVQGNALVFQLEGGTLTLSRAAVAKPLPPLKPKKTLPGKRVTPEGTELSVVLPDGWKAAWTEVDGTEVYALEPKAGGDELAIYASARQLGADEAQASAAELYAKWFPALGGTARASATFSVGGRPGGDVDVDGSYQGRPARIRFAVVRLDEWGIVFLGLAAKAKADALAPAFETVVASLKGNPPKAPVARAGGGGGGAGTGGGGPRQLARCWQESVHSTSAGGGGSSTTVRINADGTYFWRSRTSMPGYSSVHQEPGTWSATGNRITMVPQDGCETVTYSFSFQGYALIMAGVRYIPCD